MRPSSWIEIDLSAVHDNATRLMSGLDPQTKVFAVLKGDAYGVGLDAAVDTLARAGVSGFAAGTIEEALRARQLRPKIPVLVYGTYPPSAISEVAGSGLILTAYSLECVARMIEANKPLDLMIKVDCGFGRLGIPEGEIGSVLDAMSSKPLANVLGLYTHIGAIDDNKAVGVQVARFRQAAKVAEQKLGRTNLWLMAASSRVVLDRPELQFNMINPGRMLYGLLELPWRERHLNSPVFRAVKGRLMQVKTLLPGRQYGYGMSVTDRKINVGVVPFGFALGLPRAIEGLDVLVRNKPAKVLGTAGMEQVVLDLSHVPDAAPEDEVVLFDSRADCGLTAESFAEKVGLTPLEILPRLGRSLPRVYGTYDAAESN